MRNEEKVDALVQLAATVAHELNNIFTAVSGNCHCWKTALNIKAMAPRWSATSSRTARRGIELSEKLQAFAGRQKLNRTQFDLNRVVASAFTGLKSTTLQHVDVEFGLASSSCIVVADEDKFARVLEELAQNAAAAMDSHGS